MNTIATLYALRQRLGLAASDTADDPRLLAVLQAATAQIERMAGRRFCPYNATLSHSVRVRGDKTELSLDDDLLELAALTNGDGSAISLADVVLLPGGIQPASVLCLIGGNAFVWDETPHRAIDITGVWGWHDNWPHAWRSSADTVQDNPLSDSATTITVTDADGLDSANESPRFQAGHLIRIDSEYMRVLAVNTATNVLTVMRGINGTTAASHAQNTAIDTYQPAPDIVALTLQWAAWLYKEPDTRPGSIPQPLREMLAPLCRVRVGV